MFLEIWLFLAAYIISWPALAILFVLGVIFEHKRSHGWAVFTGIIAVVVSYFYLDVALIVIAKWAAAYVAVGLVWSFWRYHKHVAEAVEEIKEGGFSDHYIQSRIENLAPSKNIDLITAWIVIWPFSAVENVLGDILNVIQALVTKVFRSVYSKIYTSHIESLKDLSK